MLFSNIHGLLQRGVTLQFIVRAVGASAIEVTVLPSSESGSTGQALVPKTFTATPAEFDAEFAQIMGGYAAANTSLHEQLTAVQVMANAAKEAASTKAAAPANNKHSGQASTSKVPAPKPLPRLSDDSDQGDGSGPADDFGCTDGDSVTPTPFTL